MKNKIAINNKKFNNKNYHLEDYFCERCGAMHNFYKMSHCDKCHSFICDDCGVVVSNDRDKYPTDKFAYDYLCNFCIGEIGEK